MLYPLVYVFSNAFFTAEGFSLIFFRLMFSSPNYTMILANSVNLGLAVTLFTTLLSLPLAFLLVRYDFPGKGLLNGFILIPMVLPPFVGAIGMRQLLARFGSVNLLLLQIGVIDQPIDWLGGGFWGVVVLEVLHLYPIMYLNLAAALANVDPSLEEAARNMGANGFKLFRTVTFPLMLPGYFAGAIIVFIWAFTDLGTPLVFEYREVIAVQIFNMVTDLHQNPMGYAFVVAVIVLTLFFFYVSKRIIGGRVTRCSAAVMWLPWRARHRPSSDRADLRRCPGHFRARPDSSPRRSAHVDHRAVVFERSTHRIHA